MGDRERKKESENVITAQGAKRAQYLMGPTFSDKLLKFRQSLKIYSNQLRDRDSPRSLFCFHNFEYCSHSLHNSRKMQNYANYGKKKLTKDMYHGARSTVNRGFHRAVQVK